MQVLLVQHQVSPIACFPLQKSGNRTKQLMGDLAFALHCIRKAPHILAPAHRWQGPTQTCQTSPEQLFGTLFRQNYYASLFPAAISNSYLQIAFWQNHGTQLDSSLMIRF